MKTLGLLGGMSWESTTDYYRCINEEVKRRLGGLHSARLVLYSVEFAEIEELQQRGEWDKAGEMLADAALALEKAGAEGIIICTNTMHKVASHIQARVSLPLLHIADATGLALQQQGVRKVALLGTAYTMEQDFYKQRLVDNYGLEVMIPDAEERAEIHRIIFEELCQGVVLPTSRARYVSVVEGLQRQGAQAVILGCTEIGMLVRQEDVALPVFDTTRIHALCAVDWALS